MNFLVDHNLRGHAVLLSGSILNGGWLDWVAIRFITFDEMMLPVNSNDRVVWQLAQSNQMLLLTANRSVKGENLLEQVMREEIAELMPSSVVGIGFDGSVWHGGIAEESFFKTDSDIASTNHVDIGQLTIIKPGINQVGSSQVNTSQSSSTQVSPFQVSSAQINIYQDGINQIDLNACGENHLWLVEGNFGWLSGLVEPGNSRGDSWESPPIIASPKGAAI